jgi:early secretory antigenic target protein ESAT-6
MGDSHLVVNFPALHQASADIQKALHALESQLAQLERDAAPLIATWEGEARQGYDARQAQWRRASQDLAMMLRDIKIAVDDSAADYWSTERRAIGRF